jgi:hypothetical protein
VEVVVAADELEEALSEEPPLQAVSRTTAAAPASPARRKVLVGRMSAG